MRLCRATQLQQLDERAQKDRAALQEIQARQVAFLKKATALVRMMVSLEHRQTQEEVAQALMNLMKYVASNVSAAAE